MSLFSEAHAIRVTLDREEQKRLDFLKNSLSNSKYATSKVTYLSLVKFFEKVKERTASTRSRLLVAGYHICLSMFP